VRPALGSIGPLLMAGLGQRLFPGLAQRGAWLQIGTTQPSRAGARIWTGGRTRAD